MEGKALISSSQEVSLLAGFQSSLHTTLCLVDVSFPDGKDVPTVYVRSNNHRSRVNDFAKPMQAMVLTGLILHSRKPEEGFLPGVHAGTVHLGRCSSSLAVPSVQSAKTNDFWLSCKKHRVVFSLQLQRHSTVFAQDNSVFVCRRIRAGTDLSFSLVMALLQQCKGVCL